MIDYRLYSSGELYLGGRADYGEAKELARKRSWRYVDVRVVDVDGDCVVSFHSGCLVTEKPAVTS
jgi:hypothetical protein